VPWFQPSPPSLPHVSASVLARYSGSLEVSVVSLTLLRLSGMRPLRQQAPAVYLVAYATFTGHDVAQSCSILT
jgi:hypothetical protein